MISQQTRISTITRYWPYSKEAPMNQFSDALKTGIASARQAKFNTQEILSALTEVGEAVSELTDGKVSIVKLKVPAGPSEPSTITAAALAIASMGISKPILVDAIFAKRKIAPLTQIELARMDMSSSGYPCTLIFAKGKYTCHDKEAWIKLLKELLASPEVGKAIIRLEKEPASSG